MTVRSISLTVFIVGLLTYIIVTSTSISLQAEIHNSDQGGKFALELKK